MRCGQDEPPGVHVQVVSAVIQICRKNMTSLYCKSLEPVNFDSSMKILSLYKSLGQNSTCKHNFVDHSWWIPGSSAFLAPRAAQFFAFHLHKFILSVHSGLMRSQDHSVWYGALNLELWPPCLTSRIFFPNPAVCVVFLKEGQNICFGKIRVRPGSNLGMSLGPQNQNCFHILEEIAKRLKRRQEHRAVYVFWAKI